MLPFLYDTFVQAHTVPGPEHESDTIDTHYISVMIVSPADNLFTSIWTDNGDTTAFFYPND